MISAREKITNTLEYMSAQRQYLKKQGFFSAYVILQIKNEDALGYSKSCDSMSSNRCCQ